VAAALAASTVAGLAVAGCAAPAGRAPVDRPAASTGGAPGPTATASPSGAATATLLAAGDIASCDSSGDEATAALLDRVDGVVATLGDHAYPDGSGADFARCYAPGWGRHRGRTRPAPGNHEYHTPGARAYFDYFGPAAGHPARGYYGYDLGAWHVVVVNSNCAAVGGCHAGSPQHRWLRADLAGSRARCTLAYWHHPLFSSGAVHSGSTEIRPIFQALYDAGAELVLSGHNHQYERFAPQAPNGRADPARGIRQFVVGTGGASHYRFGAVRANSQARDATSYGILRLTLRPTGYDWRFLPALTGRAGDAGSQPCH